MRLPLFLVAAIVLIVFAIIGANAANGFFWGVTYLEWFYGSFLAFLVHLLFSGGLVVGWDGYVGRRTSPPA